MKIYNRPNEQFEDNGLPPYRYPAVFVGVALSLILGVCTYLW